MKWILLVLLCGQLLFSQREVPGAIVRSAQQSSTQSITATASRSAMVANRARTLAGRLAPSRTMYFSANDENLRGKTPAEALSALNPEAIRAGSSVRTIEVDVDVRRLTPVLVGDTYQIGVVTVYAAGMGALDLTTQTTINIPGVKVIRTGGNQ